MNYILLLYLLSISAGALDITNSQKKHEAFTESTPNKLILNKIPEQRYKESFNFINPSKDTISNITGLSSFYQKLLALKSGRLQRVNIVQIGDSHIQPDLISREVRTGLQIFFGDAGRGLVFPYQVARTNGPSDVSSSASSRWLSGKISQLRTRSASGVTGFSLSKLSGYGTIRLSLKRNINAQEQSFDYIKLFVGEGNWNVTTLGGNANTYRVHQSAQSAFEAKEVILKNLTTSVNITSSAAKPNFFGASLEKRHVPGVLFHTIGVNGARYEQYNKEPLFWQQLPSLEADLYILSMGTNEAFYNDMREELYIHQVAEMIAKLQTISPNASILITTTAESFKNGRTNPMIERLNLALKFYCNKMGIPIWDLFDVTGGVGSSMAWLKSNLLQADKIHYQQRAYSLQGALLYDAIANGYNQFISEKAYMDNLPIETKTASR